MYLDDFDMDGIKYWYNVVDKINTNHKKEMDKIKKR